MIAANAKYNKKKLTVDGVVGINLKKKQTLKTTTTNKQINSKQKQHIQNEQIYCVLNIMKKKLYLVDGC